MPASIRLFLLGALLLSLCSCGEKRRAQPVAVDGVLDLSNWDFEKDGIVDLKGEWRFVWDDFVDPMPSDKFREKFSGTIKVPSTWHTQPNPNQSGEYLPGQGYATYALKVLLPPGPDDQELALASKHHNSSARYLMVENESGSLLGQAQQGTPGVSAESTVPVQVRIDTHFYRPSTQSFQVYLQLSNFHRSWRNTLFT